MALVPGTRLGPYDITAQIGVGGMGEVYRATDTNLKRQVAIKVLPESVAGDAERLARFQREAEVLAQLNHPNIAQIHGLEDGPAEGGPHVRALVMELVEGPTLADRIAQGPITIDEALPIAKQIAEALEAAHEQGIVHRDLKPANIKVRPDGTVKVLDFGLAKAVEPTSAHSPSASMSPTLSLHATQAGMILGTAAYMSPEQARGRAADKRADIWAFGVVVYEMLTGTRLFDGEELTDVLAAVVRMDPDFTVVPATARRLVRKCLEKDPKRRLRDIGDWQELLEDAAPAASPAVPPVSGATRMLAALAALVTLLLAALSLIHFRETPPELPVTRTSLLPPGEATWDVTSLALSPDGRRLAFLAADADDRRRIWVRSLDAALAQPLAGTEDAQAPFWSPDGNSLAFFAQDKLNRIDLAGGAVQALADGIGAPRGGTWGVDGTILYAAGSTSGLTKVTSSGGPRVFATTLGAGEVSHRFPWLLPDGRHFLFAEGLPGRGNRMDVWLGSLDSPDRQKVLSDVDSAAAFAAGPDGRAYLLYLRDGGLVAQPFDTRTLQTTGEAATVAERVIVSDSSGGAFSVSANGVLAFADRQGDDLAWFGRTGQVLGSLRDLDRVAAGFRLSPDGRVLAYELRGDIWLYEVERSVRTRFTTGPARDMSPLWSPDGRTIYFVSTDGSATGNALLHRKPASGVGSEEVLARDVGTSEGFVSPDGKFLAFIRPEERGPGRKIWILPNPGGPLGGSQPYRLFQDAFQDYGPAWSPDGRWLAFGSNETGEGEVYVVPFPGPGPRVRISSAGGGGGSTHFSPDGTQLLFVDAGQRLVAVDIASVGGRLQVGDTHTLFPLTGRFEVSPDGRRVLGSVSANAPLTIVQNWMSALKR